jgi:4-amino-4-deoxy-L-arabinose transferase-like glycosyltransferase
MINKVGTAKNPAASTSAGFSDSSVRAVHLLLGVLAGLAVITGRRFLYNSVDNSTGALAMVSHGFDFLVALAIGALLLSVGFSFTKRVAVGYHNTAEEISFSFFLGTGVVGLIVLLVGLLGHLSPGVIVTILGFCWILTMQDAPELYRTVRRGIRAALATRESTILFSLFAGLVVLLLLRAATPPHVPDELIYHLPVPQQFVLQHRVFPSFDNSLGNVPFLIHMIYAVCLMAGSDIAGRLISLALALSTALAIYAFCRRFLTRRIAVLALFAFFAAGVVVELSVTTRIDVSLAGMLFASTYGMINYLNSRRSAWLWLSAILAGFSLGIKHTAGLWLIFVGVLYLTESIRNREALGKVLRLGVGYTLLAFAFASPWYIKNAIWFENPMYPFITGEVASFGPNGIRYFTADDERKLEAHFNAARNERPDIVRLQEEELRRAINARVERHPMRLWEFFSRPTAYLMAEPYQFPNYLFLVIPLIVFLKPNRWVIWLLAISLAFVFSVTLTSWIARYLLPAYPALTIVTAYTLANISSRLCERISLLQKLPEYAVAGALAAIVATSAASMRHFNSASYLVGAISRQQFLHALPDHRPIEFINQELPPNARVMTLGAQMTYGLMREHSADESWFATKWRRLLVNNDTLDKVNQELKDQGYTHILYNPTLSRFAARMGIEGTGGMNLIAQPGGNIPNERRSPGPEHSILRNWSTFTVYKERFLEPVYSDDYGYQVLRIK